MLPLAEIIPDASVTFNVNKLRLEISVPQIAIKSNARGYVPPERWDEGINALLLGYSFSGAKRGLFIAAQTVILATAIF